MAITHNNVQTASGKTLSYTPPSLTNACLVVVVSSEDVSNNEPITSVDFGATAMTLGVHVAQTGTHANDIYIAYLVAPGTSAATITVNGGQRVGITALTLDNVDQSSVVDVTDTGFSTSGDTHATSATTTNDGSFVVSGISTDDTGHSFTLTTGTKVADFNPDSSSMGVGVEEIVTAGTYTHTFTSSTSVIRAGFASVAFSAGGGGGTTHELLADDIESASEVTVPGFGQTHELGGVGGVS